MIINWFVYTFLKFKKTVHQSPLESGDVDPQQKKDFNPADGTMLQKLFTRLNSINKNMEELKQLVSS